MAAAAKEEVAMAAARAEAARAVGMMAGLVVVTMGVAARVAVDEAAVMGAAARAEVER